MSLISDTGDAERLLKLLADSIPQGPHPKPHAEWVSVRLDAVQEAIDHIEWLENGNEEWRLACVREAEAKRTALANAQEALQTAIGHLQAVLNKPRTHEKQQRADTAAREWLISIGSEPS